MDPMVQIFFDDVMIFETSVEDEAGKKPVWNETIQIPVKDMNSEIAYKVQDSDDGTLILIGEGGPKYINVFCLDERTTHKYDITHEHAKAGVISFESTWVNFHAAKERIMEKRRKALEEKKARKAAEEAEAAAKAERERQEAAIEKAKQDLIEAEKEKARQEKLAAE